MFHKILESWWSLHSTFSYDRNVLETETDHPDRASRRLPFTDTRFAMKTTSCKVTEVADGVELQPKTSVCLI